MVTFCDSSFVFAEYFMEVFFKYDYVRLLAYKKIKSNKIEILENDTYVSFLFPDVDYFNYTFFQYQDLSLDFKIEEIKESYLQNGIQKFHFISPKKLSREFLIQNKGVLSKTIIQCIYNKTFSVHLDSPVNINFEQVSSHNIFDFTEVYLNSFEAKERKVYEVVRNFKELLDIPDLELVIVKRNGVSVGVNVLYKYLNHFYLAGGATLQPFRNSNIHKIGLSKRINKGVSNNADTITAWAYNNSISLNNMLALGMQKYNEFNVYEFCTEI